MPQLLCHLFGDYVFQNQWMADNKTKPGRLGAVACGVHAFIYMLPFILLSQSLAALEVIVLTHFVIDRWRLAGYWCRWFRVGVRIEGEPVPPFLAVWLLIIVDNTFHLLINYLALRYL